MPKKLSWAKQAAKEAAAKAAAEGKTKPKPKAVPKAARAAAGVSNDDAQPPLPAAGPADPKIAAAITALSTATPRFTAAGASAPVKYAYGTAGFRSVANTLESVCVRMGMFAALLSRLTANAAAGRAEHKGKGKANGKGKASGAAGGAARALAVGIMVTASHNEERDNGLKFISETGEMLTESWELVAARVANEKESEVAALLCALGAEHKVDWTAPARLIVGRDTRPSSPRFVQLIKTGAALLNCTVVDYGLCTTPQLHWLVHHANAHAGAAAAAHSAHSAHSAGAAALPPATLAGYYATLTDAFVALLGDAKVSGPLHVDCANGVGFNSVSALAAMPALSARLQLLPFNTGGSSGGVLNKGCGADFVQSGRKAPQNADYKRMTRCCSLDGDADRVVYHFGGAAAVGAAGAPGAAGAAGAADVKSSGSGSGSGSGGGSGGGFELLDGDKIIALFTGYLAPLIKASGVDLTLGVVQTAYANGASTAYMASALGVPVRCANTGVKHLHRMAVDYDVGVYFEANGHGTVHFSHRALERLHAAQQSLTPADAKGARGTALRKLLLCSQLINQCIGDAVSDMLFVEVILACNGWALPQWAALYTDLPSRQLKVPVPNPALVTTADAERKCTAPDGLQRCIDELVAAVGGGKQRRSFVRPSGTEPVVRVYAEAPTQADADALADQVKGAVAQFCCK